MVAAAEPATDDRPLEVTVRRSNGIVDRLTFPANAQVFRMGDEVWVGWEDEYGNSYDAILTPDEGDVVLSTGRHKSERPFGASPIPISTPPPRGLGAAPTPRSNDAAEIADQIEQILRDRASDQRVAE
jgi:hypothetical protein